MTNETKGGRCAVVTGASKGIGFATAERFLKDGFRVINLSRSPSALPGVMNISADLAAPGWSDAVKDPLLQGGGGAETYSLIHNRALKVAGGVDEVAAADFREMLEVGVVGPSILNQLLLDDMRPGSSIIYIGSTLSLRATARMAAYVACKHALLGLMRSTCQDLAGKGIHTCCVCPGFTETEMLRSYGGDVLAHLAGLSTQNRLIAPAEVAEVIYFAATNPVINGAALSADLGFVEP